MPWAALVARIEPHAPGAKTGRPPLELCMMQRKHLPQQWFDLGDLAMKEALFKTALYREAASQASMLMRSAYDPCREVCAKRTVGDTNRRNGGNDRQQTLVGRRSRK